METQANVNVFVPDQPDGMVSFRREPKQILIAKEDLAQQIKEITSTVLDALSVIDDIPEHRYLLEGVEMSLVLSASGKVGLLGFGAELGSSSTFRMIFRRK